MSSKTRKVLAAILATCLVAMLATVVACAPKEEKASEESVTVPNLVSLTHADADKALAASGLVLGTVKYEYSDTVPKGQVISQDPKALSQAKANDKVNLVFSSGSEAAKDVKVPDLTGKTKADAEKALEELKLVGVASNPETSDAVAPGCVFKQSVAAGTTVKEGTKVAFTTALAVNNVTVPDLSKKTKDAARDELTKAGLGFDYVVAYNDAAADTVFAQSVPAGTSVKAGTTVVVSVSLGAKPASNVKVPNLMTFSWSDAEAALKSAGLAARYTGDPAGTVVAQDIAANTEVKPGTLVTVTLALPVEQVAVPDFSGMTLTRASAVAANVGLSLDSSGEGAVIDQWPAAGTMADPHSTVHVTLSKGDDKSGSSASASSGAANKNEK